MKKLFFAAAITALFAACSTATLININVDADSFFTASVRNPPPFQILPAPNQTLNVPSEPVALTLPSLSFLTSVGLKINVGITSSNPNEISGTLELFVGPSSATNITLYDPANKVPTGPNCAGDLSVNGVTPVSIGLTLSATSPAACAAAFNRMKSGQFKIGARAAYGSTAITTLTASINNFDVSVSGYPVQLLK